MPGSGGTGNNFKPENDNTFIRIVGVVVRSSALADASGKRSDFSNVRQHHFFVDVIEADGEMCMWSGPEFPDAILAAHELGVDWNAQVHDEVVGSAQQ